MIRRKNWRCAHQQCSLGQWHSQNFRRIRFHLLQIKRREGTLSNLWEQIRRRWHHWKSSAFYQILLSRAAADSRRTAQLFNKCCVASRYDGNANIVLRPATTDWTCKTYTFIFLYFESEYHNIRFRRLITRKTEKDNEEIEFKLCWTFQENWRTPRVKRRERHETSFYHLTLQPSNAKEKRKFGDIGAD